MVVGFYNRCLVSSNPVNGDVYSIHHYLIKFVSDLQQVGGFSGYSGFLHQLNCPPRYNWNIVESGVKHHKQNHHRITENTSSIYSNKISNKLTGTAGHRIYRRSPHRCMCNSFSCNQQSTWKIRLLYFPEICLF